MKLKTLLIIKAIVAFCLGISMLIAPNFLYSIFGASLAAGGIFAAREYGAAMIGILMLTWFARNSQLSDARWAIVLALCVYDAVGVLVTLIAIFAGVYKSTGMADRCSLHVLCRRIWIFSSQTSSESSRELNL